MEEVQPIDGNLDGNGEVSEYQEDTPSKNVNPEMTPDVNDGRFFNQLTSNFYDTCEYQNALNLATKPLKYYVNEFDSPQSQPFQTFTMIGNQKAYNVQNEYERAIPSRLNPIYQTYVEPYTTTPFLGNQSENRMYANTGSELRFGTNMRQQKSAVGLAEVDYNRWEPGVMAETSQNAGQFNVPVGGNVNCQGRYDPFAQNNVLFANSAFPRGGISSRNELHNYMEVNKC